MQELLSVKYIGIYSLSYSVHGMAVCNFISYIRDAIIKIICRWEYNGYCVN